MPGSFRFRNRAEPLVPDRRRLIGSRQEFNQTGGVMVRFAGLAGIALLAVLAAAAPNEAVAQDTELSFKPEDRARARVVLKKHIEDRVQFAGRLRQGGNCDLFDLYIRRLRDWGEDVRAGARDLKVHVPIDDRERLVAYARKRADDLALLDCPPQSAALAGTTGGLATAARILIEAGGSSTQDIKVGNGNFNSKTDASGPDVKATLSVPIPNGFVPFSTFKARFYGSSGTGSSALSGNAGTFLQADGNNQPINLNITGGRSTTELTQIGGEGLFSSDHPLVHFGMIFSPLFGAGFERVTLDTQTSLQIAPLNFYASDTRETVTDRLFITVGLQADMPPFNDLPGAPRIFVFGNVRVNFDRVTGTASYDTAQTGVFMESLRHEFSRSIVTYGGGGGGGVAWTFANGGRLELKGAVSSVPLHELVFHPGLPATLEHSQHLNISAGAALTIPLTPLTGPRPYDIEAVSRSAVFR